MNANELAVELERYLKGEEYDRLVWEIPDFLRHQQAEIEELKAHPAKDLTDEEIISEWLGNERNYYNFARAILRKAQEK
tara:strand:- start:1631 stop:1867 length:237 start_codon:yes stop_codon:yes gene_type:complete